MYHDVEQNETEWYQLRAGKITSSNFGIVMANYGKAFEEPAKRYAKKIAVERLRGEPLPSDYQNEHMQRGHEQEPIARALYENLMFCDVSNGGFFSDDVLGTSPDGLVGADGQIEIKSVIANIHVDTVMRQSFDPAYKWQLLGALMITEREWLDFVSYCADFPEGKQLYVFRLFRSQYADEMERLRGRLEDFDRLALDFYDEIITAEYIIT